MRVQAFQIPATKWWEKCKSPPNVIHINSVQQLVDAMVRPGPVCRWCSRMPEQGAAHGCLLHDAPLLLQAEGTRCRGPAVPPLRAPA